MSAVRSSMNGIVDLLSQAVSPDRVAVDGDPSAPADAVVQVRPMSVERLGRSRRDGPVLDLELKVAVICSGPRSIENVEQLLRAVEVASNYSISSLDRSWGPIDEAWLGFLVSVPVAIRLDEARGPQILEVEVRMAAHQRR